MSPAATVLIGSWKSAATLPRAIDSILAQTVSDLELIVVNDGSPDNTSEVVAGYAQRDQRVRELALPHTGIARSLNLGLEAADATYVAIQDADDWSLPTRLERQMAVLDADSETAVVGCRMTEVDPAGNTLEPRLPWAAGEVSAALRRFNPIPGTCACMRRDAVLAVGGFDPAFRYAQDYDLWSRLAETHRIVCLPEELAVRTMGTANAGHRHERAQIAEAQRVRLNSIRRRRSARGAVHLLRPALSWALPLPVKRAYRLRRGKAA